MSLYSEDCAFLLLCFFVLLLFTVSVFCKQTALFPLHFLLFLVSSFHCLCIMKTERCFSASWSLFFSLYLYFVLRERFSFATCCFFFSLFLYSKDWESFSLFLYSAHCERFSILLHIVSSFHRFCVLHTESVSPSLLLAVSFFSVSL